MKSFIIFASSYLLEGLVDDHIMQMAIYLRRYIIALYQETPNEENLREGLRCLREFAKIAEEVIFFLLKANFFFQFVFFFSIIITMS